MDKQVSPLLRTGLLVAMFLGAALTLYLTGHTDAGALSLGTAVGVAIPTKAKVG